MSNYLNSYKEQASLTAMKALFGLAGESATNQLPWTGHKVVMTIALWIQRYKQRRNLARLPTHLLRDINVTSEQVERETSKPFWVE